MMNSGISVKAMLGTLGCAALIGSSVVTGLSPVSAAAAQSSQGVTPTTITIGIPYVDLATVDRTFGMHLDQGSYPDAYGALIGAINDKGGINGRKVVPEYVAVNPASTTSGATSCTQLVQDDRVFVALAPYFGICYLEHGVPTINGQEDAAVSPGAAANFTMQAPAAVYDPYQLKILANHDVFKGKKVGVWGATADAGEVRIVDAALAKDHVDVVQTAIDSAPATDAVGGAQQDSIIAQHFQNAGVNEVVAVGSGSVGWPKYQQANQSTYTPPWVATDWSGLAGYVIGSSVDPSYVRNVLTTTPYPSGSVGWNQPLVQQCVHTIKKAYPDDAIAPPSAQATTDTTVTTYVAPANACENVAIFAAIAKAAGRHLTAQSFTQAGEGLRNVTFPGMPGAVSFGPNQPYAIGPVYIEHFDRGTRQMQNSAAAVTH